MYILIIGSILLGAILGRFFKVLVLIPACAVTLAMVVAGSAYFEHSLSLLRALLEVVVLLTSLQIDYVSGLLSHYDSERSPGDHGRARALSWSKTQHSARSL